MFQKVSALPASVFIIISSLVLFGPSDVLAGTVRGVVRPNGTSKATPKTQGFTRPSRVGLVRVTPHDPREQLIVVLTGGPAKKADPPRTRLNYVIIGESFAQPVLPVVVGTGVTIQNRGRKQLSLYSPESPKAIDDKAVQAGRDTRVERLTKPFSFVTIRERGSAHLIGRVVAFPHKYFATVGASGRYQIPDVPAGKWTVKLWYRNGWLDYSNPIEVRARGTQELTAIEVPAKLVATPVGGK